MIEIKTMANQILIGGQALVELGSSRGTNDVDYLVNDTTTDAMFIKDEENNIDYCNANGSKFFAEIYAKEEGNAIASPQSLLELKAYAFVQHCQNMNFRKADEAEFDIKFLVRQFNLKDVSTVKKYISAGEYSEIKKVISSVKF